MCLNRVRAIYDTPSDLIVDGWKMFGGSGSQLKSQYHILASVAFDTWVQASDALAPGGIEAGDGRKYKAGFHAYADEAELGRDRFRRVYLRRITCVGEQGRKECLVAQEMYVPSSPDAWPPQSASKPKKKRAVRKS